MSWQDEITIHGHKNPVIAARKFLEACGLLLDEESFEKVAEMVGDSDDETLKHGFIVNSVYGLQHLCEVGNFVIVFDGTMNLVRAYLPGES